MPGVPRGEAVRVGPEGLHERTLQGRAVRHGTAIGLADQQPFVEPVVCAQRVAESFAFFFPLALAEHQPIPTAEMVAAISSLPFSTVPGADRVYRGGSFKLSPQYARVASRSKSAPGDRGNHLGVRLARTIP